MSLWSWVLDAGGLICTYFVGRHHWWGWAMWQVVNATWIIYAVSTRQWGFIPGCLIYSVLNHRNMTSWRRGRSGSA